MAGRLPPKSTSGLLQVYHFFVVSSGSVFLASIASLATHAFPERWLRARIAYRNRDLHMAKEPLEKQGASVCA
jgi:hypothetical protein